MSEKFEGRRYVDGGTVFWLTHGWESRYHVTMDIEGHGIVPARGLPQKYSVSTGHNPHGFQGSVIYWRDSGHPLVVLCVSYLPTRQAARSLAIRLWARELGQPGG